MRKEGIAKDSVSVIYHQLVWRKEAFMNILSLTLKTLPISPSPKQEEAWTITAA